MTLRRLYLIDGWALLIVGFVLWGYHNSNWGLALFGIRNPGSYMEHLSEWRAISFGGPFGGALMAEMRAIAFVQELIEQGAVTGEFGSRLKKILIHSIADPDSLAPLGAVSKFNVEQDFLDHLFLLGRAAATKWLAATFDSVGVKTSIDIKARFL